MKSILISIFALVSFFMQSFASAQDKESFKNYVEKYADPVLLQDNDKAFRARLKLLEMAPPGSKARVATFVFDQGKSTLKLAAHLCAAQKRGVEVEFLVDSKTGGDPETEDVFDNSEDHKINEEIYKYLANCEVKVYIHNFLNKWNKLVEKATGQRLPSLGAFSTTKTVLGMRKLVKTIEIEFKKAIENAPEESQEDLRNVKFDVFKKLLWKIYNTLSPQPKSKFIQWFLKKYGKWKNLETDKSFPELLAESELDAVADHVLPDVVRNLREEIIRGRMSEEYIAIRQFNRLNHRKLFMVHSSDGMGCTLIGGRNLGDHYLTNHGGDDPSFYDADVLHCSHHKNGVPVRDAALASFEALRDIKLDGQTGREDNAIHQVSKNLHYRFKRLKTDEAENTGNQSPSKAKIPQVQKISYDPKTEKGSTKALEGASNWRVLTSTWNIDEDEVRKALYDAIKRETKEIYIETAYSEFDREGREAIEKALEKGVKVTMVTNNIFVSDGPSKSIRLFMAPWVKQMYENYGRAENGKKALFVYKTASLGGGSHMIHFKGAAFRCQQSQNGSFHKTFLIGSHNFHPRSGYSDKEHAILWDRKMKDRDCADSQEDLIDFRNEFFETGQGENSLRVYNDEHNSLYDEMKEALDSGKLSEERTAVVERLKNTLYDEDGNLRGGEASWIIIEKIRDSGLRDLLGIVL